MSVAIDSAAFRFAASSAALQCTNRAISRSVDYGEILLGHTMLDPP